MSKTIEIDGIDYMIDDEVSDWIAKLHSNINEHKDFIDRQPEELEIAKAELDAKCKECTLLTGELAEHEWISKCYCGGTFNSAGRDPETKEVTFECDKCGIQYYLPDDTWRKANKARKPLPTPSGKAGILSGLRLSEKLRTEQECIRIHVCDYYFPNCCRIQCGYDIANAIKESETSNERPN